MTNLSAYFESLENRRLFDITPTILATFPNGVGPEIATTLYAVSATHTVKLTDLAQRYKTTTAFLSATIRFAAKLLAGTYDPIAQTIDAAGDVVNSAIGASITIAARYENVTTALTAVSPKIAINRTGIAKVRLTSAGNIPATGPLTLSITADGYTLASETIHIRALKGGASIRVKIKIPATMSTGAYSPVLTTDWDSTSQTQMGMLSFTVI